MSSAGDHDPRDRDRPRVSLARPRRRRSTRYPGSTFSRPPAQPAPTAPHDGARLARASRWPARHACPGRPQPRTWTSRRSRSALSPGNARAMPTADRRTHAHAPAAPSARFGSALGERDLAALSPTCTVSPGANLPAQNLLRQRILDLLLDRALQRPCAVHRIEARLRRSCRAHRRSRAEPDVAASRAAASSASAGYRRCRRSAPRPSGWNTTISSIRLTNSGRKCWLHLVHHRFLHHRVVGLARQLLDHLEPKFEVMTIDACS